MLVEVLLEAPEAPTEDLADLLIQTVQAHWPIAGLVAVAVVALDLGVEQLVATVAPAL